GGRNPLAGVVLGLSILVLGAWWMASVARAGDRSSTIQQGRSATGVIDARRFISPCGRNTCRQIDYSVRYIAAGRVYRGDVLADDWDHPRRPGETLDLVYDPAHPGRAEIRGRPPSRTLPFLGASLCLAAGLAIAALWAYVLIRDRRTPR
ncbi:MAG: hypothetical protein QOE35_788, partial [Actinomycetota bacterium]